MPQGAREILQGQKWHPWAGTTSPSEKLCQGMPGWAPGAPATSLTHIWVSTSGGTHSCSTDKPLWLLLPGYHKKHHRANPALFATRSQRGGLREKRGTVIWKGPPKSMWEGQGHSRSLMRRLLGVQHCQQHHQAFSTTPLFWFVPFLTQFILQAWLSPI